MCLIVHSDGHLTIKVLYEQIWPQVVNGDVKIKECYDLVVRSTSDAEFDSLLMLSPQRAPQGAGVFQLLQDQPELSWILKDNEPVSAHADRRKISFVSPANEPPSEFEVTPLWPVLEPVDWIAAAPANDRAVGAFAGTNMTLGKILFADGGKIRRFDPKDPGGTTYWIRLVYEPEVQHLTVDPIGFGAPGDEPIFRVRPCCILCPQQVINWLSASLEFLANTRVFPEDAARTTSTKVLRDGFWKPGTSSRIEDHRISVVTGDDCIVFNTNVEGDCGFLTAGNADEHKVGSPLTRTWYSGSRHYPQSDPLTMLQLIYAYLKQWATVGTDAKTKEQISAAHAFQSHANVSFVVEGMLKLGLIKCLPEGRYYVESPLDGAKLCPDNDERILGNRDSEARTYLYGELPITAASSPPSRFKYKGFRVFFDMAFAG